MNPSLKAHFLNLYSIALSDTQFDEKEIALLYRIGEEKGIPKEDIDLIFLNPSSVKFHYPDSLAEKIDYLYDYAKLIVVDSIIHDEEIRTLEKFCQKFDFEVENIPTIIDLLIEAAKTNTSNVDLIKFVTANN